jgi:hypothetical protein
LKSSQREGPEESLDVGIEKHISWKGGSFFEPLVRLGEPEEGLDAGIEKHISWKGNPSASPEVKLGGLGGDVGAGMGIGEGRRS